MQTNIHVIHTDDGFTEIQWGRGRSDSDISGYVQITQDGRMVFPFRRNSDDEPFVLMIGETPGRVTVYSGEEVPARGEPVFDSDNLEVKE